MLAQEIRIRGTVQGVGFRPTVYRLAKIWSLRGEVLNDGDGVLLRVLGDNKNIEGFLGQLQQEKPPLAQIQEIVRTNLAPTPNYTDFQITPSQTTQIHTSIAPDAATCAACLTDIFNPLSRWYQYPLTNCTHCGPRLSIINSLPYDRPNTSMASFALCAECAREYKDVGDRRFHAQPIACPKCGPWVWLEKDQHIIGRDLAAVAALLEEGEIIAIKGLGGFHLACAANQEETVSQLRKRKRRDHKPFALMGKNLEMIRRYCWVSPEEASYLSAVAAPIVLLRPKSGGDLAPSLAPDSSYLGFMLPYTPLHHLIFAYLDVPLVFTSGNRSSEPQCLSNEAAREQLGAIAAYFVMHNREIVNRLDDSVVRLVEGKPMVLRRARGYAPAPVALPPGFSSKMGVLAMGGELKNTFCLLREEEAILSQHLGDLENQEANQAYTDTLNLYLNLFEHQPGIIAVDLHPEYLASKLGKAIALSNNLILEPVAHHHAHVCTAMAEHLLPYDHPSVLGIALDGLGYGERDELWGGEFLLTDYRGFQRVAHFLPVALLGGEQAIYQPWRNTYAHLRALENWSQLRHDYAHLELFRFLEGCPQEQLDLMLTRRLNSPLASSAGRLFDAVAAALGICRDKVSYEGQAAIILENLAAQCLSLDRVRGYGCTLQSSAPLTLSWQPLWLELLADLHRGKDLRYIAAAFHLGLAEAIAKTVGILQHKYSFTTVVLGGGVWQNTLLLNLVNSRLRTLNLIVLRPEKIPINDGGISLGQAVIARARNLA